VPLKFMCSTQCEMPVRPGASSPEPTRYHAQSEISGDVCEGCRMTVSPLSRRAMRRASRTSEGTVSIIRVGSGPDSGAKPATSAWPRLCTNCRATILSGALRLSNLAVSRYEDGTSHVYTKIRWSPGGLYRDRPWHRRCSAVGGHRHALG